MDTRKRPTILWYDLETFGLLPPYDRIAQFAAQRTDLDLNPLGSPIVLYGRISDDYLPDPQSCLVTGITPYTYRDKALCESDLISRINDLFSVPNTTSAGFNTIRFDDEVVRHTLFRNFLDPYELQWKNGCSRWDIIDLVRAAHDLRPEGITWPSASDKGNPVIRLTELTKANAIDQEGAHDAMVDVRATIAVARLIREKQPRIYDWYWRNRQKREVKNMIRTPFGNPFLYTDARFTSPSGFTRLVLPITPASGDSGNAFICFDLMADPSKLLSATSETKWQDIPGLVILRANRCPFITPVSPRYPEDAVWSRLGIDRTKCRTTLRLLKAKPEIIPLLRDAQASNDAEWSPVDDTDFSLYDGGFFSDSDKERFLTIRSAKPEEKLGLNLKFQDKRVPEMLFRHVCRNWPEVLTPAQTEKWKSFCAARILSPPGGAPVSWDFYLRKIEEKLASPEISPEDKKDVLMPLRRYAEEISLRIFGKKLT